MDKNKQNNVVSLKIEAPNSKALMVTFDSEGDEKPTPLKEADLSVGPNDPKGKHQKSNT